MNWKQQVRFLRQQQEREQAWSATQAERQMQFQHQESSTAHQREVADLQAAGLNPVLSATGGNGASSGSGAMASAESILPELMSIMKSMSSHSGGARVVVNNTQPEEKTSYKTGDGEFGHSGPNTVGSSTSRKTGEYNGNPVTRNAKALVKDIKAEIQRFRDVVDKTPVTLSGSSTGMMRVMTRSTAGQLMDDLKAIGTLASNSGKSTRKFLNNTYRDSMYVISREVNKLPKSQQKQFWNDFYR